jgi:hypothetical protein
LPPIRQAEPVTYTAEVFMRGMKVTVPSDSWTIYEDQPGEFNIAAPSPATANIHFWLDPYPSVADDKPEPGVGRTPAALIAWLRGNPGFIVSAPVNVSIANGIRASTFILDLSDDCFDYFVFRAPAYDFPFGTCPGEPVRLYLATLGGGPKVHTLVIAIDAKNKKTFTDVTPAAKKIITNVTLPSKVSAG